MTSYTNSTFVTTSTIDLKSTPVCFFSHAKQGSLLVTDYDCLSLSIPITYILLKLLNSLILSRPLLSFLLVYLTTSTTSFLPSFYSWFLILSGYYQLKYVFIKSGRFQQFRNNILCLEAALAEIFLQNQGVELINAFLSQARQYLFS